MVVERFHITRRKFFFFGDVETRKRLDGLRFELDHLKIFLISIKYVCPICVHLLLCHVASFLASLDHEIVYLAF